MNLPLVASSLRGIGWPAVPNKAGAELLAVLYQLEDSQWWSAEQLREYQLGQISLLFAHAGSVVPFYRERLRSIGYKPGDRVTEELWAEVPLLKRGDFQTAQDDLVAQSLPEGHGPAVDVSTSGSTGTPVKLKVTTATAHMWRALTVRDHLWQRRDFTSKLAAIRVDRAKKAQYPDGVRLRNWADFIASAFRSGPCAVLDIMTPANKQVEWLQRQKADYLLTHPSNLAEIVRICQAEGVTLPELQGVTTISEALPDALREACRAVWGLKIDDIYSSQEVGYMALQCPDHEHYHVQAENVLLEVVAEDGRICEPGEVGRVVVTALHNFATPLIRYVVGDYAEVGEPCPCGRGLPVLKRIVGRARAMVTLPTGERFWPVMGDMLYGTGAPVTQCQLIQKTPEGMELKLVVGRALSEGEEQALRDIIRERMGYPFEVAISYHDEIPRSAGGKFEDFKSEVPV